MHKHQLLTLMIPDDIKFSDLNQTRDPDGYVSVDTDVIRRICEVNGLPLETFTESSEDYLAELIHRLYIMHLQNGGEPDQVEEDLIAEVLLEELGGQKFSYPSGRA